MLNRQDEEDIKRVAHLAADAARLETLKSFRKTNLQTEDKGEGHFDPVTVADRAAEQAIRAILAAERPDDGIIGEEFGTSEGSSGLTWVLDPIDGTRGYISGTPTWGTLISVGNEDGPIFGLIDQPYIGERFFGGLGGAGMIGPHGATDLKVSSQANLSDALLMSTFPEIGSDDERRAFLTVEREVKLTRYGMDCYGYALLASGTVDLVIEAGLAAYDIHAGVAVIEAAGGIVTTWEGKPAHNGGRILAAATPELHAAALGLLQAALDD